MLQQAAAYSGSGQGVSDLKKAYKQQSPDYGGFCRVPAPHGSDIPETHVELFGRTSDIAEFLTISVATCLAVYPQPRTPPQLL
jgi:hypothetical protein